MFLSRAAHLAATLTIMTAVSASAQQTQGPVPQGPVPQGPVPQGPTPTPRVAPPIPRPAPQAAPVAPPVKLPAGVVARVNGVDMTYDDLIKKLNSWSGRPLLQQAIQAKVFEQEAKKYGVTVTPAELKAEIEKVKQGLIERQMQSGRGMMTWKQIAARDGIAEGYLADNVRLDLLSRKTYQKAVEKSIPSLAGQIKLAHIMIPTMDMETPKPDAAPKTAEETAKREADAKAQAEKILADIVAKRITFEDAAKQFSADKGADGQGSAANGGLLPYTGRNLQDKAFEEAAFSLAKPGDITPAPVRSRVGYHIIKLVQKGADAPPAEVAAYKREQLERQAQNPQALQQWMQFMMANAKVSYGAVVPASAPKPATRKPTSGK